MNFECCIYAKTNLTQPGPLVIATGPFGNQWSQWWGGWGHPSVLGIQTLEERRECQPGRIKGMSTGQQPDSSILSIQRNQIKSDSSTFNCHFLDSLWLCPKLGTSSKSTMPSYVTSNTHPLFIICFPDWNPLDLGFWIPRFWTPKHPLAAPWPLGSWDQWPERSCRLRGPGRRLLEHVVTKHVITI